MTNIVLHLSFFWRNNEIQFTLLEYCTVVWSGTSRKNIKNIEKIQRLMTRYVLNYAEVDYKDRLLMPNITTFNYAS